jgi:hypothetical protein
MKKRSKSPRVQIIVLFFDAKKISRLQFRMTDVVPEGTNVTELMLLLMESVNQSNAALEQLKYQLRTTQDDIDHFFLVQMTITVFGLY